MSEFRGLHNPDRHQTTNEAGEAWCEICAEDCDEKNGTMFHCPCCLVAEVDRLRAQVQAVRDVLADYAPFTRSLTMEVLRALDGDA